MTQDESAPRKPGLLIRIWTEPDSPQLLRARTLSLTADGGERTWSTSTGEAALLEAVLRWTRYGVGGQESSNR